MMEQNQLQPILANLFPQATFNQNPQFVEMVIPAGDLHSVAAQLKENQATRFDFLFNLTAVDSKGEFRVVYHLRSSVLHYAMVLKVITTERETPEFETVSDIWPAANPFEREAYDLMGIRFKNHPDLRRLFLEDDFQGFPLRKDFVDPINIIEK